MKTAAVGIGGCLGAMARYQLGVWMKGWAGAFPTGTLLINLAGCLFLAWFLSVMATRLPQASLLTLAVGTGFTGAFTTFSAFSAETLHLLDERQLGLAVLYVLLSVGGGVSCAVLGARLGLLGAKDGRTQGRKH